jgi:hypothetical protein
MADRNGMGRTTGLPGKGGRDAFFPVRCFMKDGLRNIGFL